MSAARVFLTSLVALGLRQSRNEGDDEDHFTSHSLFIDGSYFGRINSQSGGYLDAEVSGGSQHHNLF